MEVQNEYDEESEAFHARDRRNERRHRSYVIDANNFNLTRGLGTVRQPTYKQTEFGGI